MNDEENIKAIGQSDLRTALISVGTIGVAIALVWWFGGRQLIESVELAEQTSLAQKDTSERIGQQEQWIDQIQENLTVMQASINDSQVPAEEAHAMQERLGEMERQLQGLPALTESVREELSQRTAQRARDAARLAAVNSTIQKSQDQLDLAERFVTTWRNEYASLLTDNRGQRIAADPNAVSRFKSILNDVPWDRTDIAGWRNELSVAAAPYLAASESLESIQVTADDVAYFEQFLTQVESANQELWKREQLAQGAIETSQNREPAANTLKQAIASAEYQAVQQMLDEATQRRMSELKSYVAKQSEKIQQAEEERLAALTQVELAKKEAAKVDYQQQLQSIDAESDRQLAETRRRQLESDFQRDLSEIKSLLSPFLGSSERQPTIGDEDDPSSWIVVMNPPGPVSLGRLKGSRALDDSTEGRRRLHFVGGSPMNFRRTGSFPVYSRTGFNSPGVASQLDRARTLLLKYGDLLVEKGMLRR